MSAIASVMSQGFPPSRSTPGPFLNCQAASRAQGKSPNFWGIARYPLVVVPVGIAVLAIRIAACAVSIFGNWGRGLAARWRHTADKMTFIYIQNRQLPTHSPLPRLARAYNQPLDEVIWKESDIQEAKALRQRLIASSKCFAEHPKWAELLQKESFVGIHQKDVATGASLLLIKTVLRAGCSSESQLIKIADRFSKGFPAEAAGMQRVFDLLCKMRGQGVFLSKWEDPVKCLQEWMNKVHKAEPLLSPTPPPQLGRSEDLNSCLKLATDSVREWLLKALTIVKTDSPQVIQEKVAKCSALSKDLEAQIPKLVANIALSPGTVGKLAKLFDVKIKNEPSHEFLKFASDPEARKRFSELPQGAYLMNFSRVTKDTNDRYSSVYFKFGFGSYLFDPNHGLMRCSQQYPDQDLLTWLNDYRAKPGADKMLNVQPCKLISRS